MNMINYENMRGSTIEGVSKDRHGRDITCIFCEPNLICIKYQGKEYYLPNTDKGVETAGDFIETLKVFL